MAPPGADNEQVAAGMCTKLLASDAHLKCMATGYEKCEPFLQENASLRVECNLSASLNSNNKRSGETITRLAVYPPFDQGGEGLVLSIQGGEVTSSSLSTWEPQEPLRH